MYKKLLSFKRRSTDKTHMLNVAEATTCEIITGDDRKTVAQTDPNCCPGCCCRCCCCESCPEDRLTSCPLCTACLILPSCVGAIRALHCSFLQQAAAGQHATNYNCCQAGSKWMPQKLQIVEKTRCCF